MSRANNKRSCSWRAGLCNIGTNAADVIQVILTVLFILDVGVNFNVAVYRDSLSTWTVDRKEIARLYLWNKYLSLIHI